VVSKEQLLERLYSYSEEASNNAIEVYIHRLRKKIEPAGVTIRTITRPGLRHRQPAPLSHLAHRRWRPDQPA